MRVMHVIDSLGVGGAERSLTDLAVRTRDLGVNVSVCLTRGGGDLLSSLPPDIPVRSLERHGRWDWSAAARFSDWVDQQWPDVLHVHGRSSFVFVATAKAVGRVATPVLLHDHFGDASRLAWALRAGRGTLARYVACSPALEASARSLGVPQERAETIEAAIDVERFRLIGRTQARTALGLPLELTIAVNVGGVRPEKGHDVLLDALAYRDLPNSFHVFVIGGTRDERYAARCFEQAARPHLASVITFLGERADVPLWLAAADFAVHPSRIESGPLALIEYMASELPTVCTRTGAAAEIAERCGVGGFVDPGNMLRLRQEIERALYAPPGKRRERGLRARQAALENLDLGRRISRWIEAYSKAMV